MARRRKYSSRATTSPTATRRAVQSSSTNRFAIFLEEDVDTHRVICPFWNYESKDCDHPVHRPTEASAKSAEKVFAVTELVEDILAAVPSARHFEDIHQEDDSQVRGVRHLMHAVCGTKKFVETWWGSSKLTALAFLPPLDSAPDYKNPYSGRINVDVCDFLQDTLSLASTATGSYSYYLSHKDYIDTSCRVDIHNVERAFGYICKTAKPDEPPVLASHFPPSHSEVFPLLISRQYIRIDEPWVPPPLGKLIKSTVIETLPFADPGVPVWVKKDWFGSGSPPSSGWLKPGATVGNVLQWALDVGDENSPVYRTVGHQWRPTGMEDTVKYVETTWW